MANLARHLEPECWGHCLCPLAPTSDASAEGQWAGLGEEPSCGASVGVSGV